MAADRMNDAVETAAQTAFPDRPVDTIARTPTRPGNETALVTFADDASVYVKTATDTPMRLVRETAALRYAERRCAVSTPTVVAADPTADPPYLVTAPLPGSTLDEAWMEGADREALVRQAGYVIAGIHEAKCAHPGIITDGDGDCLDLTATTWTDTLCATVAWRASDWFADRFADLPGRLVETIRDLNPALDGTTPALLHADCSRRNIHHDPNGILDWERALVGDPAFDLEDAAGHLIDQHDVDDADRPGLRAALHDGYRERAGDLPAGLHGHRHLYRAMSYLLVPQAFDEWAPEVELPNDDLAADVRDEFDRRLERARETMA